MKTQTPYTTGRSLLAVLSLVATISVSFGAPIVYQVDDWYTLNGRSTGVVNDDTNSPNTPQSSYSTLGTTWGYFDSVTLASGDSITLNTDITVTTSITGSFDVLRFGLYQSGTKATSVDYPTRIPTASYSEGWSGFFTTVTGDAADLYRRDTSKPGNATTGFSSTGNTTNSSMTDEAISPNFVSGTPISLSLTFQRTGDDLLLSGTLGGDSFSGTYSGAFTSYSAVFDAFGINGSTFSSGVRVTNIAFANTTLTVVPEPTSVALILGAGGVFLILLRNKRQRA